MEIRYTEYDPFAWVYNRHFGAQSLRKFCPIIEELLLSALVPEARILDLCCGTGHIVRWLSGSWVSRHRARWVGRDAAVRSGERAGGDVCAGGCPVI